MAKQNQSYGSKTDIEAVKRATGLPNRRRVRPVDRTKRLTIDEINALNRHLADTWTPEMDEEIERMTRQDRLARCAKLTEEKAMRVGQRAQLMRDLKKAVAVKLRGDALGVDAELARIRSALADLELHELNATAELRAIRAELRQA